MSREHARPACRNADTTRLRSRSGRLPERASWPRCGSLRGRIEVRRRACCDLSSDRPNWNRRYSTLFANAGWSRVERSPVRSCDGGWRPASFVRVSTLTSYSMLCTARSTIDFSSRMTTRRCPTPISRRSSRRFLPVWSGSRNVPAGHKSKPQHAGHHDERTFSRDVPRSTVRPLRTSGSARD